MDFPSAPKGGRPTIGADLEALILRLAHENPRWGYPKIEGELRTLGYDIGRTTVTARPFRWLHRRIDYGLGHAACPPVQLDHLG